MINCCYIKILSAILVKEVHATYKTLFTCLSENHVLSVIKSATRCFVMLAVVNLLVLANRNSLHAK